MMGTDSLLWIGIADPYTFPDPPLVTRSSLSYPIRIGSPINDRDPANHCKGDAL